MMISLIIKEIGFATMFVTLLTLSTGCHSNVESAPSGPGQPKVRVKSNVSNINIGNIKRTNLNMFDKNHKGPIMVDNGSYPSATPNFNMENTPIDIQSILGKGLSNIVSIGNKSGKPGGKIDLAAKLASGKVEPGSASAEARVSAQLPGKVLTSAPISAPAWTHEIIENPGIVATASAHSSSVRDSPKPNKAKKSATAEQRDLKNRLLELAAKATNLPDGDGPILRYNPKLGTFERVQVDPDTKIYKEMLRKALDALSAKKLSPKKLRKILGDLEAAQPDEPELVASEPTPPAAEATNESEVAEPFMYILKNGNGPNLFDTYNTPIKVVDEKPEEPPAPVEEPPAPPAPESEDPKEAHRNLENLLGSKWSQGEDAPLTQAPPAEAPPAPEPEPAPVDEERKKLVEEVRSQLDDRINRISDLLYFRSDFLNLLLNVDDATELTPIESVFKRMILCNSDEQFCLQPDLSPAEVVDDAAVDEQPLEAPKEVKEEVEEETSEKAAEETAEETAEKAADDAGDLQESTLDDYTPYYVRHPTAGGAAGHAAHAVAAVLGPHDAASVEAVNKHFARLMDNHPLKRSMLPMPPMPPMSPMAPALTSFPGYASGTRALAEATSY